jgi:DNA-binding LacI/PurR family transcriptional regulator
LTLADVAALAGVSQMTVSRVINGGRDVSATTRVAVERAIEQTGYVAHHAARSLVTRRTNSVAFVVSESQDRFFHDPVFGAMALGANERLAVEDMQLVCIACATDSDRRRVSQYVRAGHVDGALLASWRRDDPLLRELAGPRVAAVMAGRPPRSISIPFVDVDNRGAARAVVRHLAMVGCTKIATITGPLEMSSGRDRLAGFKDAVGRATFDPRLVVQGDYGHASGMRAMAELLDHAPDIDGVFAASDAMAAGALAALQQAGRRVPVDVRVAGFDDSPIATEVQPALTTVHQPLQEMGGRMAELLVDRLCGRDAPASVILPTRVVHRDSA